MGDGMRNENLSVCSSLMEAMEDYARKIEKIVEHDPDNQIERACLYSGISGINECCTMLKKNRFLSEEEQACLEARIHQLYEMCNIE